MSDQPQPSAGWYPDPAGSGSRYWDGARWTEHTQPLPAAPPQPAPYVMPGQLPGQLPGPFTGQAPVAGSSMPPAPAAPAGSSLAQLVEGLKRGEGAALVLVAAVVLVLSTFLPWAKLSLDAGPDGTFSDKKNAWSSDVPWLIRGFDAEEYRVAVANQSTDTPTGGTDLIIILPLVIAAGGLVVATRQGKAVARSAELVAGCCGLLLLILVLEIVHLGSWAGDLQDAITKANGTATVDGGAGYGLYIATLLAGVMTFGAVRTLLSSRAH